MKILRIKTLLIIFFFLLNTFSPLWNFFTWQKVYDYKEETLVVSWIIKPFYNQETSNLLLPKKIAWYKKESIINFGGKKDLLIFKYPKNQFSTNNIEFQVVQNNKKILVWVNDDWDERTLEDRYYYSEPILVDSDNNFQISINSKNKEELNKNIQIIWINTNNYEEKLSLEINQVDAENEVVSRKDWWADETLRYTNNPKWIAIFKKQEEESKKPKTARELKQEKKIRDIRSYLAQNFSLQDTPISTTRYENWNELVWPIEKTKRVEKIFIHHTAEYWEKDNRDDTSILRAMYYYHAIVRGWWDIGYNYVIWRDWTMYEWRAWWDYNVGAHALWNNKSTVGISVMGNFQNEKVSWVVKNWIDRAITFLSKKYWIDLNKESISHKECWGSENCLLKDYNTLNLIWHRDAWSTACPGNNLYLLLWDFREYGTLYSSWLNYIENTNTTVDIPQNLPKWPDIRVKLSYSWETVSIKSYAKEKLKLQIWTKSWTIKIPELNFKKIWKDKIALVVWKKILKIPSIKISWEILEISSWSRKPSWDKSWNLNDNKFRWTITIYNDNWELVVVNELPLENYLKWLAEISNTENEQKAKTILVAARTYALFYTKKENRKFPWKDYDWSDDPDVFQKYLGYGFEQRSVNIGKYVDDTNSTVIKHNNIVIKPWYFNQSIGKTRSSKEYCEIRINDWSLPKNTICEDTPYLQSVEDPAWISDSYKWHWVGISWAWAKALSDQGKTYDEIIKYFLKWVTVEKIKY